MGGHWIILVLCLGCLIHPQSHHHTGELIRKYPRMDFDQNMNPTWTDRMVEENGEGKGRGKEEREGKLALTIPTWVLEVLTFWGRVVPL